ncbi:MAG: HNH endonuclease [Bacteroidota bacterium]
MTSKRDINDAWGKGHPIKGKNPDLYRKDDLGNEIYKPSYGKKGEKSWGIDHKKPLDKGGSDSLKNLRPLQWEENREKSNKYPHK